MYTMNGKYFSPVKEDKRIIEHMDNSTASFNTMRFHDSDKPNVNLSYLSNKLILSKENEDIMKTYLDVNFANEST